MNFRFVVSVPGGIDRFGPLFQERGIVVRRGLDTLLHRILGLPDRRFPVACRLFAETVSIPILPSMSDDDVDVCARAVADLLAPILPVKAS